MSVKLAGMGHAEPPETSRGPQPPDSGPPPACGPARRAGPRHAATTPDPRIRANSRFPTPSLHPPRPLTPSPAVAPPHGIPPPHPVSRILAWRWLIGGLGTLVLLAVCGLSTVLVVLDEQQGRAGRTGPPPAPTALPRDISSQQVDPAPLTVTEVFPTPEIWIGPEEEPYRVLKTEAIDDCRTAVTGDLGPLLRRLGCGQVVRGTLRPPDGAYLATAGVFNLPDSADALRAHRDAKPVIEAQRGRFHGMVAGTGTEPVMLSSAQVGWHVRGHFLVYGVIARADGAPITADDPIARQILYDLVQLHLRDEVLGRRASLPVRPVTGTVTTSRSTSAGG